MNTVSGPAVERSQEILTDEALDFLALLHTSFAARRAELLERRAVRREEVRRTGKLDFLPETQDIRDGDWQVAPAPADLLDRRVEITGPTERKMMINALNSGARVWLADLEDRVGSGETTFGLATVEECRIDMHSLFEQLRHFSDEFSEKRNPFEGLEHDRAPARIKVTIESPRFGTLIWTLERLTMN